MVRGFSTPYGLYRTLYENSNAIVVFDDCDSILRDPTAINLLKAALDSYSKRYVSWNTERGSDLPSSFLFEGGVIFISNETLASLDQAVRTRSLCVDLSMTADQKLERMVQLVASGDFLEEYTMDVKKDALNLIRDNLAKGIKTITENIKTMAKANGNSVSMEKQLAKIREDQQKQNDKLIKQISDLKNKQSQLVDSQKQQAQSGKLS